MYNLYGHSSKIKGAIEFFFLLFFRDLQVFEELFSFACPKFLSPVVPNYDNVNPNYHKEPFQQQLKVFAEEVQQQAQLSTIRRYNSSLFMLRAVLSLLMKSKNYMMMCNELSFTFSNWLLEKLWNVLRWLHVSLSVSWSSTPPCLWPNWLGSWTCPSRSFASSCWSSNTRWRTWCGPVASLLWMENFSLPLRSTSTLTRCVCVEFLSLNCQIEHFNFWD